MTEPLRQRDGTAEVCELDELASLTRRLVAIPTVNPPGDTTAACRLVADELVAAGFSVSFIEAAPGMQSIVAEYVFPTPGPTLLFNGHLDVVPIGDDADRWTHDPWAGVIEDGKLYGRGALDMKGPLAAVITAARAAVADAAGLAGRLLIVAVADEEQGGERGTGALVQRGLLAADGAVVVEPSDGGIVLGHRGLCFVEIETHGRSAHASVPAEGVNAVDLMVDALVAMRTLALVHEPHPSLGAAATVAGTTIHGGHKSNVIPATCIATVDVRTVPGMTREGVIAGIERHLAAAGLKPGRDVTVRVTNWGEPGETDPAERIVQVCADAHAAVFGSAPDLRYMAAFTDGGWLAHGAGIPTVMAIGPGGLAGCHVIDEHVVLAELAAYVRVYLEVIRRFLSPAAER